jgi:hypothetical protein
VDLRAKQKILVLLVFGKKHEMPDSNTMIPRKLKNKLEDRSSLQGHLSAAPCKP